MRMGCDFFVPCFSLTQNVGAAMSSNELSLIFLHGEYGWQGFVLAVLGVIALVALFNELANRALKGNRHKKHRKYGGKR